MKRKSYCERGKKVIAEKKFDLSVIARSKATKQSRERKRAYTGLLRYARNCRCQVISYMRHLKLVKA